MCGHTNGLTIAFTGARSSSAVSVCLGGLGTVGADAHTAPWTTALARIASILHPRALVALLSHAWTHIRPCHHLHGHARHCHRVQMHWRARDRVCGRARLRSRVRMRCQPNSRVRKRVRLCHCLRKPTVSLSHVRTCGRHHHRASYTITVSNLSTKKESHKQQASIPTGSHSNSHVGYLRKALFTYDYKGYYDSSQGYHTLEVSQVCRNMWNTGS